jgi:hypothetical protein
VFALTLVESGKLGPKLLPDSEGLPEYIVNCVTNRIPPLAVAVF